MNWQAFFSKTNITENEKTVLFILYWSLWWSRFFIIFHLNWKFVYVCVCVRSHIKIFGRVANKRRLNENQQISIRRYKFISRTVLCVCSMLCTSLFLLSNHSHWSCFCRICFLSVTRTKCSGFGSQHDTDILSQFCSASSKHHKKCDTFNLFMLASFDTVNCLCVCVFFSS